MENKRFKKVELDSRDYRGIEIAATVCRILLTPIFQPYRIYLWVWDGSMFK